MCSTGLGIVNEPAASLALPSHPMKVFAKQILASCPSQDGAIGLSQRKPRNRAKSPSVQHNVSPCSTASAAKWASGTRLACTPGSARNSPSSSACRSVGCGIHAVSQASQACTCRHASPIDSGCSKDARISHPPKEGDYAGPPQADRTGTVKLLTKPAAARGVLSK